MYQCRLINYSKCITLLGDVDGWGGYVCVCVCVCVRRGGAGTIGKFSVLSTQLFCELKASLKKKSIRRGKK